MTNGSPRLRPLRVLLSEGTSTSAREAVTALGLGGHHVEICDPNRFGLARFSRFVAGFHRCPGLRADPLGFRAFVETLLAGRRFDVLLPIHEQGLLFARVPHRLTPHVAIALPSYASYRIALDKARFSRLLTDLALSQPRTRIVTSSQLRTAIQMPCVIKTAIGTASRGVWMIRNDADLATALQEIGEGAGDILVQDLIEGATEKAQAVFARGKLIGHHCTRQIAEGAGGGDAIKLSVRRDQVRADLVRIGRYLNWHGALSVDYLMPDAGGGPLYIDCNPRLVEPMSAWLAGVDLVDALLRVSLGETVPPLPDSRADVRTHQAMQALLGIALRGGTRRDVWREGTRLLQRRGAYSGSVEELTPLQLDRPSALPLAITVLALLISPRLARPLTKRGWGAHLLDTRTIRIIETEMDSV